MQNGTFGGQGSEEECFEVSEVSGVESSRAGLNSGDTDAIGPAKAKNDHRQRHWIRGNVFVHISTLELVNWTRSSSPGGSRYCMSDASTTVGPDVAHANCLYIAWFIAGYEFDKGGSFSSAQE